MVSNKAKNEKLWGSRFANTASKIAEDFNASINIDKRLYKSDIKGSIAHVKMLAKQSIITQKEADTLVDGLLKIEKKINDNKVKFTTKLEDIHTHIENELNKICPNEGKKLHTARSRNDQIALDTRIYLKLETKTIVDLLYEFQKNLLTIANKNIDVIMPGYTHLQRAQPILLSHHLMAYYQMFKRNIQRFEDAFKRIDIMPLGAAALAGTTYPLDREYTKELLSFSKISDNSIDCVSDRDFVLEFIFCASLVMIHFSRLCEELILWSSSEFDFIEIADEFTTGSSIMPQKKNPDTAELIRGKTGSIIGNLMSVLVIMKSLPLAYNKDMQEDKKPLFDTIDTLKLCINICSLMFENIKFNKEKMYKACSKGFLNATDFADYLVSKSMAFRQAHKTTGKAVVYALKQKKELNELSLAELEKFSKLIEDDVYEFISIDKMIQRRITHGGTGLQNVKQALKKARKELDDYEKQKK